MSRTKSAGPNTTPAQPHDPRAGAGNHHPAFEIVAMFDNGAVRDANTGELTTTTKWDQV